MSRSIIATIRGGSITISVFFFFFTYGQKSLSLLLVVCEFGDLENGILIWVLVSLCLYVCLLLLCLLHLYICLLHLCLLMKICWFSTFWCSWIVFVDMCTWGSTRIWVWWRKEAMRASGFGEWMRMEVMNGASRFGEFRYWGWRKKRVITST